jgi:GNAT superfamily N-acetyltransferase
MRTAEAATSPYHRRMSVRRSVDPAEFLAAAEPLLLADEARHNLMLGIAGTLRDHPGTYEEYRLWLVADGGDVTGAALQTPPFNLVLAQPAVEGALPELAEAIHREGVELPGVTAAIPEVDSFADAWEALARVGRRLTMASRIYRVTEVKPPTAVPGEPRPATEADRTLLADWLTAFRAESFADPPAWDVDAFIDASLVRGAGAYVIWEDDGPVSLAGWGGRTPNGARIGPVYTPPERRRRGYASAVTAAVSSELLASGRQFCFLYTDLANPTSNKIYVDIGYEPVCDSMEYAFVSDKPP